MTFHSGVSQGVCQSMRLSIVPVLLLQASLLQVSTTASPVALQVSASSLLQVSASPDHRTSPSNRKETLHQPRPKLQVVEAEAEANEAEACTDLVNHGTHFTVQIEVGTPGQKFDVVADTGSDAVLVPSCACVKAGYCNAKSRCFQGTNRSTTFAIEEGPKGPPTIRMMFGSGPVQAVVASDTVRVGNLQTKMKDGILLMTDQLLNIKGQFEGILGLGLPSGDAKKGLYSESQPESEVQLPAGADDEAVRGHKATERLGNDQKYIETHMKKASRKKGMIASAETSDSGVTDDLARILQSPEMAADLPGVLEPSRTAILAGSGNLAPTSFARYVPKKTSKNLGNEAKKGGNESGIVVKGFMEEAGINRFSMCFNDGTNGVLRLGTKKVSNAHASVGQVHWGLDFRGVSVGDITAPVEFCKPGNMTKGQKTPCGAIPDSGTTALMAPKDHLIALYESLCDRWDRCKKNYTAMVKAADGAHKVVIETYNVDPFHIEPASKAVIFQQLILDCRTWLTKDEGLDELPAIHFHVAGANDTKQTLSLFGWSYIIETQEKEFKYIYKNVPGLGKLPVGKNFTGKSEKVCSPAFSPMEYSTKQNGPVWILGTPIFYEYQVGYDMATQPPEISFANTTCGSCGGAKASFMSQEVTTHRQRHARQPRQIDGPFRMPNLDFTKPL